MGRGKGLACEPQSPPVPGKQFPLVLRVQGVVLALVAQAPDEDLQVVGLAGLVVFGIEQGGHIDDGADAQRVAGAGRKTVQTVPCLVLELFGQLFEIGLAFFFQRGQQAGFFLHVGRLGGHIAHDGQGRLFGGHAAVIYMRIRKVGGDGDAGRTRRLRTVLSTLTEQYADATLDDALRILGVVSDSLVTTNMKLDDMMTAVGYALELRGVTPEGYQLPPRDCLSPITYVGMQTYQVDFDRCREYIRDILNPAP